MLQALQRQAITSQHLAHGDRGSALLVSLDAVRKLLPTGKDVGCHGIQKHGPIQAGMAMHSGDPLGHPAAARISMGAHQSSTPKMASQ